MSLDTRKNLEETLVLSISISIFFFVIDKSFLLLLVLYLSMLGELTDLGRQVRYISTPPRFEPSRDSSFINNSLRTILGQHYDHYILTSEKETRVASACCQLTHRPG
jgi:hypothetical protein